MELRTDEPERRFSAGTTLITDNVTHPTLTIETMRWHSGRLLLHLEGVTDRSMVEELRGVVLSVDVDPDERPADPDEFYDHQLVGLSVVDRAGVPLGTVGEVVHGAQDLLVVKRPEGRDALVPFVASLVPEVDVSAGRIVVDLPDGLLDLGSG